MMPSLSFFTETQLDVSAAYGKSGTGTYTKAFSSQIQQTW